MIRRMLARLLRVAPPAWAMSGFVLFYLLCESPVWYVQWKFGRADIPKRFGPTLLGFGGFLLGAYRAIAFHPYFRPGYLRWLKTTPWTVNRPLPLGPLELVPEDGVVLGALVLLGTALPDFTSLYIINLFLFGHVITLISTFWKTGASAQGYCALLFLGFVPQLWSRQWAVFAILAGVYFVVHEGLWRALRNFPWQGESFWRELGFVNVPESAAIDPSCGWSFDRFHRDIRLAKGIDRADALLCCMLGSWWIFSACSLIVDGRDRIMTIASLSVTASLFAPFGRILRYVPGYSVADFVPGANPDISVDYSRLRSGICRSDLLIGRRVACAVLSELPVSTHRRWVPGRSGRRSVHRPGQPATFETMALDWATPHGADSQG